MTDFLRTNASGATPYARRELLTSFFTRASDKSVCAAGGEHRAQGLEFVLPHRIAGAEGQYRFCRKCHAMFVLGQGGRCPAGQEHDAAGAHFALEREGERSIDPG